MAVVVDWGAVAAVDLAADMGAVVLRMRAREVAEALVGRDPAFARSQTNLRRVRHS